MQVCDDCSINLHSIFTSCISFSSEDRRHPAQTAHIVPKLRKSSAETHEVRLHCPDTENINIRLDWMWQCLCCSGSVQSQLEATFFMKQHNTHATITHEISIASCIPVYVWFCCTDNPETPRRMQTSSTSQTLKDTMQRLLPFTLTGTEPLHSVSRQQGSCWVDRAFCIHHSTEFTHSWSYCTARSIGMRVKCKLKRLIVFCSSTSFSAQSFIFTDALCPYCFCLSFFFQIVGL